jgi:hypothetical protein
MEVGVPTNPVTQAIPHFPEMQAYPEEVVEVNLLIMHSEPIPAVLLDKELQVDQAMHKHQFTQVVVAVVPAQKVLTGGIHNHVADSAAMA